MSQPVLCYVRGAEAWFTTRRLEDQFGDDWNDAPYEHNAGDPYEWRAESYRDGALVPNPEPQWEIVKLFFEIPWSEQPDEYVANSPWSVEQVNRQAVPWVQRDRYSKDPPFRIWAGTTLDDFKAQVRAAGGRVWVEEP